MANDWQSRWEVVDKNFGAGGQGTTWLLESKATPPTRAVLKALKAKKNVQARSRFRLEAESLAVLSPLNLRLPKVLEDGTEQFSEGSSELYLIMEYVQGKTLANRLADLGRLYSVDEAIAAMSSLMETVAGIHSVGVVHRDLKPDNVIYREADGDLVIVDFGLTTSTEAEDLTRLQETIRSHFITLPELMMAGPARRDSRVDVTCLAALFYYMLTGNYCGLLEDSEGRMPHRRPSCTLPENIQGATRRSIELLLDQGLSSRLERRFATVGDLQTAIDRVKASEAIGTGSLEDRMPEWSARVFNSSPEAKKKAATKKCEPVLKKFHEVAAQTLTPVLRKGGFALSAPGISRATVPSGRPIVGQLSYVIKAAHAKPYLQRLYAFELSDDGEVFVSAKSTLHADSRKAETYSELDLGKLLDYSDEDAKRLFGELEDWLKVEMEKLVQLIERQENESA